MAKVAFLGLGQMATPMATRLLQAGHELTVWNRTPDRAKPVVSHPGSGALLVREAGTSPRIT
jgi:3-hydroxyisobutyrate dehydrogenase-like beta-hydroxyacid dehydrogenase